MKSNTTCEPGSIPFTPDQLRALGRFDLRALVKDLTRRQMAINEALECSVDKAQEPSPHLVRLEAETQIIDWIVSATRASIERAALARLTPESLREVMRRLCRKNATLIWDSRRRLSGKAPTERQIQDGPSFDNLDQYVREELHVSLPAKKLSTTLGPTCDKVDFGKSSSGFMASKYLLRIFQALGEPEDLNQVRELQIDPEIDGFLHDVMTTANMALESVPGYVGLFPLNYGGRYAMEPYAKLLQNSRFKDRSYTIHLCEAERLYLVDRLNATQPVHPLQCSALHRLVDDLRGSWPLQCAMPNLSQDLFNRWCLAWRQTDRQRRVADPLAAIDGYVLNSYLPTPGLPVPPIGSVELLNRWVEQRLHRVLSADEASKLITALFAEQGEHGIEIHLSHDDVAVLSEALIQRTLQPPVPLPELAMIACLLGKVGLPWLPPAGPLLPLHVRGVSASLVLGAAGLLPPELAK